MKILYKHLLFLAVICFSWTSCTAEDSCLGDTSSNKHYSVYLIPRLSATQLFSSWSPFLDRLGKESNICFDLVIPKKFSEFENAVLTGKPDFALLNPYHQVMVARSPGYIPLVRDEHSKLAGVIIVNKESPIQTLEQLDGKTVAFPAPNAYVASLLMRAMLAQKGIHITPKYLGSHSNVYRAVALGDIEAGGGANTTLSDEPKSLQSELRVLFTSPSYMPHPFSAHPRVPPQLREKVIQGFLKIYADASGKKMLKAIQIDQPSRADYARDYKLLEKLNLKNFVALEK